VAWSIAGYIADELLGVGSTGEVWRGHAVHDGQPLALKRLRVGAAAANAASLRREAGLLASFRHEHVVGLYDVLEAPGAGVVPGASPGVEPGVESGVVLALELAEGGSLAALLSARRRLRPGEVVTVGGPVAEALAAGHAAGLIHGDVSPGNVLFTAEGKPLLSDLGTARLVGESGEQRLGSPAYLDPVVARGAQPGPAADVFSLAGVCYTALTGAPPWLGNSSRDTLAAAREGHVVPLRLLAPEAPERLVAAISAALDRDPGRRPTAGEFATLLYAACAAEPVALRRTPLAALPAGALTYGLRPATPPGEDVLPGRHRREENGRLRLRWLRLGWLNLRPGRIDRPGVAPPDAPPLPWRLAAVGAVAAVLACGAGVAWAVAARSDAAGVPEPLTAPAGGAALPTAVAPAPATRAPTTAATASPRAPTTAAPESPLAPAPVSGDAELVRIARELLARRDAAFVSGDRAALDHVHVAGSAASRSDQTLLAELSASGSRVEGLRHEVLRLVAERRGTHRAVLTLVDQLAPYRIVSRSGLAVPAAGRGPTSSRVELVLADGQWWIAAIARDPPLAAPAPTPTPSPPWSAAS